MKNQEQHYFKPNLPINPQELPHPSGKSPVEVEMKCIPELGFPIKLEHAVVKVYIGANEIGEFNTAYYDVELLAPNIVKIKGNDKVRVIYNTVIDVQYLKYYNV